MIRAAWVLLIASLAGCSSEPPVPQGKWGDLIQALAPLHEPLGAPQPGDWLASRNEPGQTFTQYQGAAPIRPRGKRKLLYVQPLGPMSDSQAEIVEHTAEFMRVYFNTPVKVQASLPLSLLPSSARRDARGYGEQLLTTHIMGEVLYPRLPDDAAAYIAFTAMDLWPGDGWNFVFGQASLRRRVGVWSGSGPLD